MIGLYEEYKLIIFSLLLIICIIITIWSYIGYRKRKYNQLFITYGYIFLTIGMAITIFKIILHKDRIFFPIVLPFAIIGLVLVTIGERKERRKNNNLVQ